MALMTGLLVNKYSTETVPLHLVPWSGKQTLTLALNGENSAISLMSAAHCAVFSWPLDWAGKGNQVVILRGAFVLFLANHLTPMLLGAVSSGVESRDNHNYVSVLLHHPKGSCISTCVL